MENRIDRNKSYVANNIRRLIARRQCDVKEFAIRVGIKNPGTLNNILRGTGTFSVDTILRIANREKVSLDWIFQDNT